MVPADERRRRNLVLALLAGAFLLAAFAQAWTVLSRQPAGLDFLPLWAAGGLDVSQVYDFHAVSAAQSDWVISDGKRPFVYPPSALLLFGPLAALPFETANLVWTLGGLALFTGALWMALPRDRRVLPLALALLSPPAVLAATVGQTTFLIGGLAVLALQQLSCRPLLAGGLLALAAVIKPNLVLFAPVALIATGQWRALAGALLAGSMIGGLSLAVHGPGTWQAWLQAMPRFQALIAGEPSLLRGVIAPSGPLQGLGLSGAALTGANLVLAAGGGVLVWRVFRRTADLAPRLAALFGGALIAAPYAMGYDAALLAPAAALALAAALRETRWLAGVGAFLLLAATGYPWVGALALIALTALLCGPAALGRSAFFRPQTVNGGS